jgi:DNA-binding HxlR family transcriptional regulator
VARSNALVGHRSGETRRAPRSGQVERQQSPATAAPELDRLIHERIRLGIVSALAANESLSFSDLKKLLRTTDGNLSVHARKLEEANYIVCAKYFEGRLPKTVYRLTAEGRQALESYLDQMETLIHSMRAH